MSRGVRMSDWLATDYRRLSDPGPAVPDWFWADDEDGPYTDVIAPPGEVN
ncbi:Uncharacterised protein [Mycobacteroides abscessus subsp. massiliense]|nr:Uncharacterised protein [Mycobacteroides abscessus subsp. massiliense]